MFPRLRSPVLKNSGSTARDHLASERTFLAWLRTGLGFIALGIAVERFSQFEIVPPPSLSPSPAPVAPTAPLADKSKSGNDNDKEKSETLVLGLLGVGSGSIVYGTSRYFSNMRLLERGLYKPSFYGAAGLSVVVVGGAGAACWGVWGKRGEGEGG